MEIEVRGATPLNGSEFRKQIAEMKKREEEKVNPKLPIPDELINAVNNFIRIRFDGEQVTFTGRELLRDTLTELNRNRPKGTDLILQWIFNENDWWDFAFLYERSDWVVTVNRGSNHDKDVYILAPKEE